MKNITRKYRTRIRNHEYEFTAHSTKAGARLTIHKALNPCLVELTIDGRTWYDAFPKGHPISDDAEIIERCTLTPRGYKWMPVEPRSMQELCDEDARTGRGY